MQGEEAHGYGGFNLGEEDDGVGGVLMLPWRRE